MGMAGVASDEYSLIQSVLVRNALPDGVYGIPLDSIPRNIVGLEDPFRRILHFLDSRRFPRAEVLIGGRRNLDIKTDHVIFSWDYHY